MENNNLIDLLQGQLSSGGMLDFLSQQIGVEDKEKTATATSGIVSTLIGALAKNTSTQEGASSLYNALERDHDGSILDDITGMLSGNKQPQQQKALDGAGILWHLLGDKQNNATNMISNMSGMDTQKVGNLMTMLAPIVMGMLGKTQRQQGLDIGGLANLLNNTASSHSNQNPTMSLITRFLDSDGDGSIVDDVANMGLKMLGDFFKKR